MRYKRWTGHSAEDLFFTAYPPMFAIVTNISGKKGFKMEKNSCH